MSSEIKIFENEKFGNVRIAMSENGEPLFPSIYTLDDVINVYGKGDVKITKDGSLEISKYIGLQMKGSGKEKASYHSLQFKDRGYKF